MNDNNIDFEQRFFEKVFYTDFDEYDFKYDNVE
jgi:hypothetical protein